MADNKREMFRHTVATLAYRGGKVLRDAPAEFANYRASETSRTPGEILAHLGDLLDWALVMAQGRQVARFEIADLGAGNRSFLRRLARIR